jgi:hypothetical protein
MKKLIALLVILAVFSTAVFAAPAAAGVAFGEASASTIVSLTADTDDLFATVDAVALTDGESATVEGEGPVGGVVGAVLGGIGGAIGGAIAVVQSGSSKTFAQVVATIAGCAIAGALTLGTIGSLLPTP